VLQLLTMDLIDVLRVLLNFFELLACIIGFIYWNKLKNNYWKWLPVYLATITATELIGNYFGSIRGFGEYNIYLYQYFAMPLQFLFFCWLFYENFSTSWQKIISIFCIVIFIISWFIEILSKQKSGYWFISLSYDAGTIILLVLILIFLTQLISGDEILNFKTNIMFWVAMGLFAGYICTIPYYIWRNYLIVYEKTRPDLLYTAFYGFMFLNYLMYSLFCMGFIKWKQTN
jgi:hypothetical protein